MILKVISRKVILFLNVAIVRVLIFFGRLTSLSYVELCLTTRCTLKCKDCANLNTHYYYMRKGEKLCDTPLDIALLSIQNLLNNVKSIEHFRIMGGEVFLYDDIIPILKVLRESKKIERIFVVTNGTLIPKDDVLEAMAMYNIECSISNYGARSSRIEELQQVFTKYSIKFMSNSTLWHDFGDTQFRNRTKKQLKSAYQSCLSKRCKHIFQGYIYSCPKAAHGVNLELFTIPNDEIIDLIGSSNFSLRRKLYKMYYRRKYSVACNYCDPNSYPYKIIPAAIQLNSQELKLLQKENNRP